MAEEQASPARKLEIANYFIMSAPPGESSEVLADVSTLIGSDLSAEQVNSMMEHYNQTNYAHFETDDKKVLCSAFGKADGGYVDAATGDILKLDHTAFKGTKTGSSKSVKGEVDEYRKAIEAEMTTYLSKQYKKGKVILAVYGEDDGKITICISGLNKKLSNFWSGAWKGTFSLNVSSKSSVDMSCHAKVEGHYFEDGNVQLHASNEKKAQVTVSDPPATAKAVVAAVGKFEENYQAHLEEMYVDMHKESFKNMRRFLPKTKTLFDWNTHSNSLASELTK